MRTSNKLLIATASVFGLYVAYFLWGVMTWPVATVANHSSETLRHVVLAGDGYTNEFGDIAPHQSATRRIGAHGMAKIELSFTTASGEVKAGEVADLQEAGGYKAFIAVDGKLQVTFAYAKFKGY
jgi:hypothetical protein